MKCRLMKSLSTSFLHYFLYGLCCLSLCLVSGLSPVNAINLDTHYGGQFQFLSWSRFYDTSGNSLMPFYTPQGGQQALGFHFKEFSPSHVFLQVDRTDAIVIGSVVNFYIHSNYNVQPGGYDAAGKMMNIQPYNNDVAVLDVQYFAMQNVYRVSVLVLNRLTQIRLIVSNDYSYGNTPLTSEILFIPGGFYTLQNEEGGSGDLNADLTEIKKEVQAVNKLLASSNQAQIDAILNASDQAHKDSQAQQDAINNQTKQEQDQYEKDKQEEHDREESAKNDGNGLLGIFNIFVLNPFAGIWELFNAGGCASIPTIARWVGSEDTVYCSWWPQSIRATLTPVFSIASMVLLFGFFVRWLGGGDGIEIKGKGSRF